MSTLPTASDAPQTTHEHAKLLPSVDYAGPAHSDIKDDPEGGDPSPHLAATLSSHALCLPQATVRETVLAIGIRPRLPQELTDVVLDFLWDNDSALRACALVCRAWHLYAVRRGLLAGHLHLETASALSSLIKCLPTDAKRLSEVHSVKLTEAPHAATPWLHRAAPQLGRALEGAALLVLRNWRPARAPGPLHPLIFLAFAQFRAVDTLYLSHCTFASAAQFQRLLGEFPQLRDLTLVGVYVLARGSTSAPVHAPPALECLWLGNSHLARPGEDEEPVAGCLAGWFAGNEATLEALRELRLRITHDLLREGELASFGRLVEVVAPRIRWLRLDFAGAPSDTPSPAADWQGLKLEHCERVRILRVFRSTAALHELSLLSPQCRIEVLELRRWTFRYGKKTDWAALATALERDVFSKLKKVVDARLLQGPEETRELEVFIGRMQRRGVEFEDRTESPFWDWH